MISQKANNWLPQEGETGGWRGGRETGLQNIGVFFFDLCGEYMNAPLEILFEVFLLYWFAFILLNAFLFLLKI